MKKVLVLLALFVMSCSNENIEEKIEDAGVGILSVDATAYAEHNVSETIAEERLQYGCAKAYLQIPRQFRNSQTGEIITQVSHELWSIPVQKLPGNEVWTSIDTPHNTLPPDSLTANLKEGESTYAFVTLSTGEILYDQEIRPVQINKKWYVCENYYCDVGGCQDFSNAGGDMWTCNPSQERLLSNIDFEHCPCIFNDTGYPHCGLKDYEEQ